MKPTEYSLFIRPHARALRQLLLDVDFFIADSGKLRVFSVEGRIKSYESANEKRHRLKIPIDELQDLAAIRIVLATKDEVEVLANFFHDASARSQLKVRRDDSVEKKNGYRSRHIILDVGSRTTHSMHDVTVEIQLSTILQHAYAELHDEVIRSASEGGADEPLTPFAFQRLAKEIFQETVPLSDAVWQTRFLIDLQCTTIGQTRAFLSRSDVLELRERFRSVNYQKYQSLVDQHLGMPLYQFYTYAGVRLDATHKFLDSLEKRTTED